MSFKAEVKMASWEPALVAAITRAVGGDNPIERIDHEAKVIEIKRDARVGPSVLRAGPQRDWDLPYQR